MNKRRRIIRRRKSKFNGITFLGKQVHRKLTFFVNLYGIRSSTNDSQFYTFSSTTSATSPILGANLYAFITPNIEFTALASVYALMAIRGVKITADNLMNLDAMSAINLPPFYLDIAMNLPHTNVNAYYSDTNFSVQPIQTGRKGVSKYYNFPRLLTSAGGYPVAGADNWIATGSLKSSPSSYALYLTLGYAQTPSHAIVSTTYAVSQITVEVYAAFTKPFPST